MHRLLERQIKRTLGLDPAQWQALIVKLRDWADQAADQDHELARGLFSLPALLDRISDTYAQSDRDLALLRRSLELSSEELTGANERLRLEAQAMSQALATLQWTFDALRKSADGISEEGGENLVAMAEKIVELTRERERISQALAKSEERFELAMRGANDGLWDYDLVNQRVFYSPRWKSMIGHEEHEIGSSPEEWSSRLHPDDRDSAFTALEAHLSGLADTFEGTFRFRHRDGHYLWILSRGLAVRDHEGKPIRIVGTHSDISTQKAIEADLVKAKELAETASRAKSEFLANMSHEIRTPMNGVLGMLNLTMDTPLTEEQLEYLVMARSSADSLLHIINDILDFSKIEAGRLDVNPVPVDVVDLAQDLVRLHRPACDQKGLSLSCVVADDVPRLSLLDPVRLRQVLVNLLGNAIKFTISGSITLEIQRLGHALRFAVRDTGIGIPQDKQALIFEAFSQADSSITRRFGGTGLGLSISYRLVGLMGGAMSLTSEPGRGSMFSFLLPIKVPEISEPGESVIPALDKPAPDEEMRVWRILLAEDNPINRKLATTLLGREGHQVMTVEDGQAVLDALARDHFDLLLMDMEMPGMNGLEATRRIRSTESPGHRLPILALTANVMPQHKQSCLDAGMDGFIGKPIHQDELFGAIRAALETVGTHTRV